MIIATRAGCESPGSPDACCKRYRPPAMYACRGATAFTPPARRRSALTFWLLRLAAARRDPPGFSLFGFRSRERCHPRVELSTADLPIDAVTVSNRGTRG